MSYINLQSRDRTFKVQAFHTFPDDDLAGRRDLFLHLLGDGSQF